MPRGGARPRRPSVRPRCPARPASASHGICRALLVDNLGRPSDESTTTIERTWTRFPGRAYAQAELVEELRRWVPAARLGLAKQLFLRSGVTQRHFAVPPAEMLARGRSFAAKNDRYKRAVREQVSALCRTIAGTTTPEERATVDLLATASCTGFQIPAMDALVIDELRLPRGARRLNLTQHGCAAGAAAIGVAHEWLAARPRRRARGVCCGGGVITPHICGGGPTWPPGRRLDEREPRYLNLRAEKPILGLDRVKGDAVVLVEGPFDWLTAIGWGFDAGALLGTRVSERVLRQLDRFTQVYLALDNDEAGHDAIRSLTEVLGLRAIPVPLPTGVSDVSALAQEGGRPAFISCILRAANEARARGARGAQCDPAAGRAA